MSGDTTVDPIPQDAADAEPPKRRGRKPRAEQTLPVLSSAEAPALPSLLHARDFEGTFAIAEKICRSELVPTAFRGRPADIVLAWEYADRLGVPRIMGLKNIMVVNGCPVVWGDLALALAKRHPDCADIIETFDAKTATATCIVKMRGRADVVRTFTESDAKAAKLWGKSGPWQTHPARMLQLKARAFAIRDALPDALCGLHLKEEMDGTEPIRNAPAPLLPPVAEVTATVVEDTPAQDSPQYDTYSGGPVSVDLALPESYEQATAKPEPAPLAVDPITEEVEVTATLDDAMIREKGGLRFVSSANAALRRMRWIGPEQTYRDLSLARKKELLEKWAKFVPRVGAEEIQK